MSFTKGQEVEWADVKSLYTRTNTQRKKFGLGTVTVPSNPGQCKPAQVKTLNNAIEDLKDTTAGSKAETGISIPSAGTLLYPGIFKDLDSTLDTLEDTSCFTPCFTNPFSQATFHSSSSSYNNNGFANTF